MFWKYNIWGILCILLIFIASATPGDQLPPSPFFDFDKIVHAFIYGVLQVSLLRGFQLQTQYRSLSTYAICVAVIFSASYGILMEVMQGEFFRNRSFDLYDAAANVAGVVIATVGWILLFQKKIKKKTGR